LSLGVCSILVVCLLLATTASEAKSERRGSTVTISLLANNVGEPGYKVVINNFHRAYPDIRVEATYAPSTPVLSQLLRTQLAAGNAPDYFVTYPGCGTSISVCVLAKAGYLASMGNKPWALKRSVPLATAMNKRGKVLFAFTPIVSLYGVFTNDDLFKSLRLKVPETFPQLLDLCRKAKALGTVALVLAGNTSTEITSLLTGLAVPLVYAKDKKFLAKLKAGTVTFAGTPGWRQALQEFVDMNAAGCFQPGATGTSNTAAATLFAQGRGLMMPAITNMKGLIDVNEPQFTLSHHLFPGGTSPSQVRTYLHLSLSAGVNAHSSAEKQKAAQTFVDFFARPKQNARFARVQGGMTQYQFLKRRVPDFMKSETSVVEKGAWVISPVETFWNAKVTDAMAQNQIGLITGQRSVDDVLKAMDTAWKLGPD
jgi:raffinose/stachyose/melibiose transport system substrate-binding protein